MSYTNHAGYYIGNRHVRGGMNGLGDLPAATSYPSGSEFAIGYTVTGLSSAAAPAAVQTLRDSVAYGFRGTLEAAGWGPAYGVPSGVMYAKIKTGTVLTGAQLSSIAVNVGGTLQQRLGTGITVVNTYLHQLSGGTTATTPGATAPDLTSLLTQPGTAPLMPGMLPADQSSSFFTQSVGGIPMWGIIAGGVVGVGAVAFALTRKPAATSAAVKANRRRTRRNSRRRRSN